VSDKNPSCNVTDAVTAQGPYENMGAQGGEFMAVSLVSLAFFAWAKAWLLGGWTGPWENTAELEQLRRLAVQYGVLDLIATLQAALQRALEIAADCSEQFTAGQYDPVTEALLRLLRLQPQMFKAGTVAACLQDAALLEATLGKFEVLYEYLQQLMAKRNIVDKELLAQAEAAVHGTRAALNQAQQQHAGAAAGSSSTAGAEGGTSSGSTSSHRGAGAARASSSSGSPTGGADPVTGSIDPSCAWVMGGQVLELSPQDAAELQELTRQLAALGQPGAGGDARLAVLQGVLAVYLVDSCVAKEEVNRDTQAPIVDLRIARWWLGDGKGLMHVPPDKVNTYAFFLWGWARRDRITPATAASAALAAVREADAGETRASHSSSSQAALNRAAAAAGQLPAGAGSGQQQQQRRRQPHDWGASWTTWAYEEVYASHTVVGGMLRSFSAFLVSMVASRLEQLVRVHKPATCLLSAEEVAAASASGQAQVAGQKRGAAAEARASKALRTGRWMGATLHTDYLP
jgi:hypothetical protein